MQHIRIAHGAQIIKNRIPLLKRHRGGFEYLAACRDYPLPLFFKMHTLGNRRIAPYGYCACIGFGFLAVSGSGCLLRLHGVGSYLIIPCFGLRLACGGNLPVISYAHRRWRSQIFRGFGCGIFCGKPF